MRARTRFVLLIACMIVVAAAIGVICAMTHHWWLAMPLGGLNGAAWGLALPRWEVR